jgi:hypothetical protein
VGSKVLEKIELIPEIPSTLKVAAMQNNLVPFVGAGISMLAGAPNWDGFANAALRSFVPNKMSYAQLDQILTLSPRVKLSIALDLQEKYNQLIDFNKLLEPSPSKKEKGEKVYDCIKELGNIIVTTNYDNWLDEPIKLSPVSNNDDEKNANKKPDISPRIFYDRRDLTIEKMDDQNTVFHIHGSTLDRKSMILTTINYLNHYTNHSIYDSEIKENSYLTFLRYLFKTKNVLFMGYGLSELEILEYILQKGLETSNKQERNFKHFVLQGFYSHQLDLVEQMKLYFSHFGIGLIEFSRDKKDHEQVIDILDSFASSIPKKHSLPSAKRMEMEALI